MTEMERLEVAEVALLVMLVWFVYAFMYARTRADSFREDLFTIRDELFDFMWKNGVRFDQPAYQLTREALNGMVRGVEALNPWNPFNQLLFIHVIRGRHRGPSILRAIDTIEDRQVREHFGHVHVRIGRRVLEYMFLEGPSGLLFRPWRWIVRRLAKTRDRVRVHVDRFGSSLTSEFVGMGRYDRHKTNRAA